MRALILLLLLVLGPASARAKPGECSLAQREYERMLAAIPQNCSSAQDCSDLGIQWSECGTPRFHLKDALDASGKTALRALRSAKKKECGWIEPPCPAIPVLDSQILCLKGSCSSTEEFFAANKNLLKLRLLDAQSGKPLSGLEVTVLAGHILYCVTTPCPEGRKTQVLKTDSAGVLALPRSLLHGKISIRFNGAPNGQGKTGSLEELSLSSLITLSESPIRF